MKKVWMCEGVVVIMVWCLIVITLSIIPLFSFFTRKEKCHSFFNAGTGGVRWSQPG